VLQVQLQLPIQGGVAMQSFWAKCALSQWSRAATKFGLSYELDSLPEEGSMSYT